jgi:imidazolonepropionase
LRLGTGAIEIKSGYGLTIDGELRFVINNAKLSHIHKATFRSTCDPIRIQRNRKGYIDILINKMLPEISKINWPIS